MDELQERLSKALSDSYTIERVAGKGGMATVFRAREHQPVRRVALKVLDPDASSLITRTRFLREVDLAGSLVHPHILPIYTAGQVDDLLYCVMPFIEGDSLRQVLARRRTLPVGEAIQLVAEVADALDFAHSAGIIHRDIKPENILVSEGHALVADFGIAKAFKDASALQLTQAGVALGTPAYMSPEQARGRELGPPSDIYSLGCVLYEVLAGSPPFKGNPRDVMRQHSSDRPPRIRSGRGPIPGAVIGALNRAMSKDPDARFNTAGEFAATLRALASAVERSPQRRFGAGAMATALGATVLVVGTLLWRLSGGAIPDSVLVAAFDNQTGHAELDSIGQLVASGISGRIPPELGRALPGFSRDGGRQQDRLSLLEAAAAAGARTLVHGAYYLQADSLQFMIVVTDIASGTVLGAVDPVRVGRRDSETAVAPLWDAVSSILSTHRNGPPDSP